MKYPSTSQEASELFNVQIAVCGEHRFAKHLTNHRVTPFLVESHALEIDTGTTTLPIWIVVEDEASNRCLGLAKEPYDETAKWLQCDWSERMYPDWSSCPRSESLLELIQNMDALSELPDEFWDWITKDC